MRWHILRTLLHKEFLRHAANRGGIALALLLVVAAILLSFFGRNEAEAGMMVGGVQQCFIDYAAESDWSRHLRSHVPEGLKHRIKFRGLANIASIEGRVVYPPGTGAIQLRTDESGRNYVSIWHPGKDSAGLAPYEAWFWRESLHFFQQQNAGLLGSSQAAVRASFADVPEELLNRDPRRVSGPPR